MTEQQPEARAVCEHFYASHCYRGMSIRLCMTCGDPDWDDLAEQLGGTRHSEPLVMPADEFAAVKTVAERLGMAGCPTLCDDDCELNPDGCHEVHVPIYKRWHAPGWSCGEVQRAIAEAVSAEKDRADAAEAKLAEIAEMCLGDRDILAIIGSEDEGGVVHDRDFAGPVL